MKTLTPAQEDIAVRAYYLYIENGCQNGRDLEYWLQAEKDIGSRFFTPPADEKAAKPEKKTATKKAPAQGPVSKSTPSLSAAPAEPSKPVAKKTSAKKTASPEVPAKKVAKKKA